MEMQEKKNLIQAIISGKYYCWLSAWIGGWNKDGWQIKAIRMHGPRWQWGTFDVTLITLTSTAAARIYRGEMLRATDDEAA